MLHCSIVQSYPPSNTDRLTKQETIKPNYVKLTSLPVSDPKITSSIHEATTCDLPPPTYHLPPLPARKSTPIFTPIKISSRTILVARSARTPILPIVTIMRRRLYVTALRRTTILRRGSSSSRRSATRTLIRLLKARRTQRRNVTVTIVELLSSRAAAWGRCCACVGVGGVAG
jgi:hypothetical protein